MLCSFPCQDLDKVVAVDADLCLAATAECCCILEPALAGAFRCCVGQGQCCNQSQQAAPANTPFPEYRPAADLVSIKECLVIFCGQRLRQILQDT